ncbi:MAG: sigma-54 dependent transcriptional regulator, partial [Candidatus Aminicenantes bacterium]|nr:sigma-54 dependent transcriptional regulator [Candidatus Aminicenantes bacterium]
MNYQARGSTILLVDDDEKFCESLKRSLGDEFEVQIATNKEQARQKLWTADVILLDINLDKNDKENKDGMTLLSEFLGERPQLPIIMITAYGNVGIAVEAMKLGAMDFLEKPLDLAKLRTSINNALKQAKLFRKVKSLEREIFSLEPTKLIGENKELKEIRRLIDFIANDGYITVLIQGETGTGKELVARLIHQRGWRSEGPFVPLSLAALSQSILESELFGHERGAFTDARERKIGYIEQAHKGVLFLDDIDLASLEVQTKLLRFLEERTIYRLGSPKPIKVDVQVVTATNQDLPQMVREKRFREDLYYRLNSIKIRTVSYTHL